MSRRDLEGWVTYREGPKTTFDALRGQIDESHETIVALFSFSIQPGPQPREITSSGDFDGVNESIQRHAATCTAGFIAVSKDQVADYLE